MAAPGDRGDPGASIVVRGFNNNTRDEDIAHYMQNKKLSGGGPIQQFNFDRTKGEASITFRDPNVARRVYDDGVNGMLELNSAELQVSWQSQVRGSQDQSGHNDATIIVKDIKPGTNPTTVNLFFENGRRSGGGPIDDFFYDETKCEATIRFVEQEVAERLLEKGILRMGTSDVRIERPPDTSRSTYPENRTIVVSNIPASVDDMTLELFFESPRYGGGGPIECMTRDGGTAHIIYENSSDAERMVAKGSVKLEDDELIITKYESPNTQVKQVYSPPFSQAPMLDAATIVVKGVGPDMKTSTMKLFFESERRSGGGWIEEITDVDSTGEVTIKFADVAVAERVLSRGTIKMGNVDVRVEKPSPPQRSIIVRTPDHSMQYGRPQRQAGSGDRMDTMERVRRKEDMITVRESAEARNRGRVGQDQDGRRQARQEPTEASNRGPTAPTEAAATPQREQTRTVIITGIPPNTSPDTLRYFFENKKKGGGEMLDFVYEKGQDTATVTYKDPGVAAALLRTKSITFNKTTVEVKRPICESENFNKAIVVEGFADNTDEEDIEMYFEGARIGGGAIQEIQYNSREKKAMIVYEEREIADRILRNTNLELDEEKLRVSRPTPQRSSLVAIRDVPQSAKASSLKLFFESPRSGGGIIAYLQHEPGLALAIIAFEQAEAAERVLQKRRVDMKGDIVTVCGVEAVGVDPRRLLITGLKHDEDKLTVDFYLESICGENSHVELDAKKHQAICTFPEITHALKVLCAKDLELNGSRLSAQWLMPMKKEEVKDTQTDTVVILRLPGISDKEGIRLYCESSSNGGGPIKKMDFEPRIRRVTVTFKSSHDAESFLGKGEHVLDGEKVDVSAFDPTKQDTILVTCLADEVTEDQMRYFFESASSKGGTTRQVLHHPDVNIAEITFVDPGDAASVCNNRGLKMGPQTLTARFLKRDLEAFVVEGVKTRDRNTLKNCLTSKKNSGINISDLFFDPDNERAFVITEKTADVDTILEKKITLERGELRFSRPCEMDKMVLVSGFEGKIVERPVRDFFGNRKNGGTVTSFKLDEKRSIVIIGFESMKVVVAVLNRETFDIGGHHVSVSPYLATTLQQQFAIESFVAVLLSGCSADMNVRKIQGLFSGKAKVESVYHDTDSQDWVVIVENSEGLDAMMETFTSRSGGVQARRVKCHKSKILIMGFALDLDNRSLRRMLSSDFGQSVRKIEFATKEGVALVEFTEPVQDFISNRVSPKKYHVHRAVEPISVQVHGEAKLDVFYVQLLLEERCEVGKSRQSGDAMIVTPKDGADVEKFRNGERLEQLILEHYYHGLGLMPPNHDRDSPAIKLPTGFEFILKHGWISKFFAQNERNEIRKVIDVDLSGQNARADWNQAKGKAVEICCTIDKNKKDARQLAESWEDKCRSVLDKHLENISRKDLQIPAEAWEAAMKFINQNQPNQRTCQLDVNQQKQNICLTGIANEVKRYYDIYSKEVNKLVAHLQEQKNKVDDAMREVPWYVFKLLMDDIDDMKRQYTKVTIEVSEKNHEIRLTGPRNDVINIKLELNNIIQNDVHVETISCQESAKPLLRTQAGFTHFTNLLSDCSALWKFEMDDHEITVASTSRKEVNKVKEKVAAIVKESRVNIPVEVQSLVGTAMFTDFIKTLEDENNGRIHVIVEKTTIILIGIPDALEVTVATTRDFFQANSKADDSIEMDVPLTQFMAMHMDNDLRNIEQKYQEYKINIQQKGNDRGFSITGSKVKLAEVKQELLSLTKKIVSGTHEVKKPGMYKFLSSQKGKDRIKQIERERRVLIKSTLKETEGAEDHAEHANITFKKKIKISVIQGDLTRYKVDAVVNAANVNLKHGGGVAGFISRNGGESIQEESDAWIRKHGTLKEGGVAITGPGLLPSRYVIHAVGPTYKDGRQGEDKKLAEAVTNTLKMMDERGLKSVAMPALSTGIFGYPIKEAVCTILAATRKYLTKTQSTQITHISFVDINANIINQFKDNLMEVFEKKDVDVGHISKDKAKKNFKASSFVDPANVEIPQDVLDKWKAGTKPLLFIPEIHSFQTKKGVQIRITEGNIQDEQVDVMLNSPTDGNNLNSGFISNALVKNGGQAIVNDFNKKKPNGIQPGEIVWTTAGDLDCRELVHIATGNYTPQRAKDMNQMLRKVIEDSDNKRFEAIAIPAIGTGGRGFPFEIVAKTFFDAAINCNLPDNPRLRRIIFVLYPGTIHHFNAHVKTLAEIYKPPKKIKPKKEGQGIRSLDLKRTSSGYETSIANVKVSVTTGDLTKVGCDVIVNPTNKTLDLTKGKVSMAMAEAGGSTFKSECKNADMRSRGIAVTGAGKMKANKVIHVDAGNFSSAALGPQVKNALMEADKQSRSIAFPALGTGEMGSSAADISGTMFGVIASFCQHGTKNLGDVRIVLYDKSMLDSFVEEMKEYYEDTYEELDFFTEDTNIQGGIMAPRKKVPKMIFTIYAARKKYLEQTIESFDALCNEISKVKVLKDANIVKMLGQLQDKSLAKIVGLRSEYDMDVKVEGNQIVLEGDNEDITEAIGTINLILMEASTQKHESDMQKLFAAQARWLFYDAEEDAYKAYSDARSAKIEEAFSQKKTQYSWRGDTSVSQQEDPDMTYVIDFKTMKESIEDLLEAEPVNVRREDRQSGNQEITLPGNWSSQSGDEFKIVTLKKKSAEYDKIKTKFIRSVNLSRVEVVEVQRIENPSLYKQYMVKRNAVMTKLSDMDEEDVEKKLWHGTKEEIVSSISKSGFNRSYSGANAAEYGDGVYFAVAASYSSGNTYSPPNQQGIKHMFFSRVAVGKATKGQKGWRVCPPIDRADPTNLYDSLTDEPGDFANMYVIFHDTQAYPEYLIKFKTT